MTKPKKVKYKITKHNDLEVISATIGGEIYVTESTNPNWARIVKGAKDDDPTIADLFEPLKEVEKQFKEVADQRLSERLTIRNRAVYWDGDRQDNALTKQILRFLTEGLPFGALVAFYDKISQNPSRNSQSQLFGWLQTHRFTITDDGDILGYKGYAKSGTGFLSTSAGHAFVNDKEFKGQQIPCKIGDVVTMPRNEVADNPSAACSTGLHIGTPTYAKGFGNVRVAVLINPRDVVSVPSADSNNKMRVCRYYVLELAADDHVSAMRDKAPKWEPEKPVDPVVEKAQEAEGLEEPPPVQPKSEILEDEKPVAEKAKAKRASTKGKGTSQKAGRASGARSPAKDAAKSAAAGPIEATRDAMEAGKIVRKPPESDDSAGHTVVGQAKVDWNDPAVRRKLKAADTPEKRRKAFPDVSDSTLRKRYKEATEG